MRFARSLARFPGTVYLRYAHEMNGYWYPWSRDARGVPLGVAADGPALRASPARATCASCGRSTRTSTSRQRGVAAQRCGATGRAAATSTPSARR